VTLLVLSLFPDELLGPLVLDGLRAAAAEEGYDLQVGSLRGVLARQTRLAGVRLTARDPGDVLVSLDVDRLVAAVSVWGLLRGRDDALSLLRATGVRLELDLVGPDGEASDTELTPVPERLPELELDALDLRCRVAGEGTLSLRDARVRVAPPAAGGAQAVTLDAPSCVLDLLPAGTRHAALAVRGTWDAGVLALDSVLTDESPLLTGSRVELPTAARDALGWDLRATLLDGTLALRGEVRDGTLETRTQAQGLSIASAVALLGTGPSLAGAMPGGRLAWQGELTIPDVFSAAPGRLARARAAWHVEASELAVPDAVVRAAPAGPDGAPDLGPRELSVDVALRGGALVLSGGVLETPGGRLLLRHGRVTLDAPTPALQVVELDGEADFPDLAALGAVFGGPAWGGRLRGTVRAGGPLSELLADVGLHGEDVAVAGRRLGRVTVSARADRRTLTVDALEIDGDALRLQGSGRVRLSPATLEDVVLRGELSGGGDAPLAGVDGTLAVTLRAEGPLLDPRAAIGLAGEHLTLGGVALDSLRLRATHASGELVVEELEATGADGSLALAGTLAHASGRPGRLHLRRLELAHAGGALALARPVQAELRDGRLLATPCVLEGGGGRLELSWSAPVPDPTAGPGDVRLMATDLVPPPLLLRLLSDGWRAWRVDADLHLGLADDGGGERELSGTLRVAGLEGVLAGAGARVRGDLDLALDLRGTRANPRGRLVLGVGAMMQERGATEWKGPGQLSAELLVRDGLDVRSLRVEVPGGMSLEGSGRVDGLHAQAPLDLRLVMAETDIGFLAPLLGDVRRLSGRVGADLAVGGVLGAPLPTGELRVHDGELRLANAFPPLDDVSAHVVLGREGARLRAMRGELGGSPFTASGALVRTAGGPRLELSLEGRDLLLYRGEGVKVRADADLLIAGPPDGLTATGELVLRNSHLVRHINLLHAAQGGGPTRRSGLRLFSFDEPPLDSLRFEVRVRAHEPFVLDTNIVSGGLTPELRLTGTGRTPIVTGTVFVEPSRVLLPGGTLRVTAGRVLFEPADPFRPRLQIDARARQRGHDIAVSITGPYDQPVVALSSVPPLPGDQLVLLLLTGQPPADESFGGAGSGADRFAVYVGQDLMARWLGSEGGPGQEGLLDRLELEVAGDVTVSGEDSMQVSYRLTDRPREEGPITSLRAERDVYDKVNFGIQFLVRRP
jgi:hypothetical protein